MIQYRKLTQDSDTDTGSLVLFVT